MNKELEGLTEKQIDRYVPAPWEQAFFEAYLSKYGHVYEAAKEAGVTALAIKRRRRTNKVFDAKMKQADHSIASLIEFRAMSLAIDGYEMPVFHQGALIDKVRHYDTKHIEWMLERLMPERYHLPEVIRMEGAGGAPLTFAFAMGEEPIDADAVEDAELEDYEK